MLTLTDGYLVKTVLQLRAVHSEFQYVIFSVFIRKVVGVIHFNCIVMHLNSFETIP